MTIGIILTLSDYRRWKKNTKELKIMAWIENKRDGSLALTHQYMRHWPSWGVRDRAATFFG